MRVRVEQRTTSRCRSDVVVAAAAATADVAVTTFQLQVVMTHDEETARCTGSMHSSKILEISPSFVSTRLVPDDDDDDDTMTF